MQGMRVRYRNPRRSPARGKEEKVEKKLGVTCRRPCRVWNRSRCSARTAGVPVNTSSTTCLDEPAGCGNWRTNISSEPRSDTAERWYSNHANITRESSSLRHDPFQFDVAAKSFQNNSCDESCRYTAKRQARHLRCGLRVPAGQESERVQTR